MILKENRYKAKLLLRNTCGWIFQNIWAILIQPYPYCSGLNSKFYSEYRALWHFLFVVLIEFNPLKPVLRLKKKQGKIKKKLLINSINVEDSLEPALYSCHNGPERASLIFEQTLEEARNYCRNTYKSSIRSYYTDDQLGKSDKQLWTHTVNSHTRKDEVKTDFKRVPES